MEPKYLIIRFLLGKILKHQSLIFLLKIKNNEALLIAAYARLLGDGGRRVGAPFITIIGWLYSGDHRILQQLLSCEYSLRILFSQPFPLWLWSLWALSYSWKILRNDLATCPFSGADYMANFSPG